RPFKEVSNKNRWNKQSVRALVKNIVKNRQLRSAPSTELPQLSLVQKPRNLAGNSFHSEPLLPKEHRETVSSFTEPSLVRKAPSTESLPEFIDRRKDLSYTIFVLESANANVKRMKASDLSLLSEKGHRNLRKKKSHFPLIARKPASSALRNLVNSPERGVFSSLGDLNYPEKAFSEVYAISDHSTEKPLEKNQAITDNFEENILESTVPEETALENKISAHHAEDFHVQRYDLIPTAEQTTGPHPDFILAPDEHFDDHINNHFDDHSNDHFNDHSNDHYDDHSNDHFDDHSHDHFDDHSNDHFDDHSHDHLDDHFDDNTHDHSDDHIDGNSNDHFDDHTDDHFGDHTDDHFDDHSDDHFEDHSHDHFDDHTHDHFDDHLEKHLDDHFDDHSSDQFDDHSGDHFDDHTHEHFDDHTHDHFDDHTDDLTDDHSSDHSDDDHADEHSDDHFHEHSDDHSHDHFDDNSNDHFDDHSHNHFD
ncbi:histidine-rich glycoprotein-like, partial [Psammomys obesus]|uniref:histidine-rich glycoprotein-like n=1 Tax=Psammomys obesus TaxID=48139 RepID=UPI002452DA7E